MKVLGVVLLASLLVGCVGSNPTPEEKLAYEDCIVRTAVERDLWVRRAGRICQATNERWEEVFNLGPSTFNFKRARQRIERAEQEADETDLQGAYEKCIAREAVKLTRDDDPPDPVAMVLSQGTCQASDGDFDEAFGPNEFSRKRVAALMQEMRRE